MGSWWTAHRHRLSNAYSADPPFRSVCDETWVWSFCRKSIATSWSNMTASLLELLVEGASLLGAILLPVGFIALCKFLTSDHLTWHVVWLCPAKMAKWWLFSTPSSSFLLSLCSLIGFIICAGYLAVWHLFVKDLKAIKELRYACPILKCVLPFVRAFNKAEDNNPRHTSRLHQQHFDSFVDFNCAGSLRQKKDSGLSETGLKSLRSRYTCLSHSMLE